MSMTYWEGVNYRTRQKAKQAAQRRLKAWNKKHTACSTQEKQAQAKKRKKK